MTPRVEITWLQLALDDWTNIRDFTALCADREVIHGAYRISTKYGGSNELRFSRYFMRLEHFQTLTCETVLLQANTR